MRRAPVLVLLLAALAGWPAAGQVMRCTEGMGAIADSRLEQALGQLKAERPEIHFQPDEQPCRHAKASVAAIAATLRRNHLRSLAGYEFAKIVSGDSYFTVERFQPRRRSDLSALASAMEADRSRKLRVKANTSYDYFVADASIVVMISDARGRAGNAAMFAKLRESFAALPR